MPPSSQAPADLYPEERRQAILAQAMEAGRVSVAELSRSFGVSEVTIRSDLQALTARNLIVRTHGGAVPVSNGMNDLALALRRQRQVQEKSRIGQAGAARVVDGDAIFLDASSTSLAIAQHLKERRHLSIITNSLAVAQEMLDAPGVTVFMFGGTVQRETASLIGTEGLALLDQFNIRKGFFGAHGISDPEGLTDVNADVAAVKRPLVALCRQVVAVLDASKWGRVGVASFATLGDIDLIITDAAAPAAQVEAMRERGVAVQQV
jgi:DeoR/GlpR family transcriptional regulator of sugar metabolism